MKIRTSLAIVLASLSTAIQAACFEHMCSNTDVERLYVKPNGTVYVGTSGDETQLNCSPVSGVYTTLTLSNPGSDAMYSALLAAQMAGKKANIRISEGSSNCEISYITLDKQ